MFHKAKFPIPNNTLYSLTLVYNKWHNCAEKKKGKEKPIIKTTHSAEYVITFFFLLSCQMYGTILSN